VCLTPSHGGTVLLPQRQADQRFHLGDSLFGPIDPLGTVQMLMKRKNIVNIMGNCDEILLEDSSESLTYRHVKPLLRAAEENWISEHKDIWRYDNLLFCHGTPWDTTL